MIRTDLGQLSIRGQGLHLNKIDVDDGELSLEGAVDSLTYTDDGLSRGGFFSRLFR